jgi:hypothetical protein
MTNFKKYQLLVKKQFNIENKIKQLKKNRNYSLEKLSILENTLFDLSMQISNIVFNENDKREYEKFYQVEYID